MPAISTYDTKSLCAYFDANFRKSKLSWLTTAAENIPVEGEISGVPIGRIGRAVRGFAKRTAIWEASRAWIRPQEPRWQALSIGRLQQALGVSYLSKKKFVEAIRSQCLEWQRDHPDFRRWIDSRLALLDYAVYEAAEHDVPAQDIKDQGSLLVLASLFAQNRQSAIIEAEKIGTSALSSAGQLVCDVLGMKNCNFTANIMIPVPERALPQSTPARELWNDIPANKFLMVVQETDPSGSSHMGYYVPLWRPSGTHLMPGAIEAYYNKTGSSVFIDDLPPFEGIDEELRARWLKSLAKTLHENMFVSIPLVTRSERGVMQTPAVLNVNVVADTQSYECRRALHREWLLLAKERVAKYVRQSLWTISLTFGYTQKQLLIGKDLHLWDICGMLPAPDRQHAALPEDEVDGEILSIEHHGPDKGQDQHKQ